MDAHRAGFRIHYPDKPYSRSQIFRDLLINLVSKVAGRDHFDGKIGRELDVPLRRMFVGKPARTDERDVRLSDFPRRVGEALVAAVGGENVAEAAGLHKSVKDYADGDRD